MSGSLRSGRKQSGRRDLIEAPTFGTVGVLRAIAVAVVVAGAAVTVAGANTPPRTAIVKSAGIEAVTEYGRPLTCGTDCRRAKRIPIRRGWSVTINPSGTPTEIRVEFGRVTRRGYERLTPERPAKRMESDDTRWRARVPRRLARRTNVLTVYAGAGACDSCGYVRVLLR
jgi:hypothetical protein